MLVKKIAQFPFGGENESRDGAVRRISERERKGGNP